MNGKHYYVRYFLVGILIELTSIVLSDSANAQHRSTLSPKNLLKRIEILGGLNQSVLTDNGYGSFISRTSNGTQDYSLNGHVAYSAGFGTSSLLTDRFYLNYRVQWERITFEETEHNFGVSRFEYQGTTRNDYISFSVLPKFFLDHSQRIYVSTGIKVSHLRNSVREERTFSNGVLTSHLFIDNSIATTQLFSGLVFAAGTERVIFKHKLGAELQLNINHGSILDVAPKTISGNTVSILITYKLFKPLLTNK